jgi:hypothetical protein
MPDQFVVVGIVFGFTGVLLLLRHLFIRGTLNRNPKVYLTRPLDGGGDPDHEEMEWPSLIEAETNGEISTHSVSTLADESWVCRTERESVVRGQYPTCLVLITKLEIETGG